MTDLLIINATIMTPGGTIPQGWLLVRNHVITAIGSMGIPDLTDVRVFDAGGLILLPGFIDIHVHGAMGADVMDGSLEGLREMALFFAKHGVTGFLPTTLTAAHDQTLAALESIKAQMYLPYTGAEILGAHLEGPYLNIEQSGAQNKSQIRRAARAEAMAYLDMDVIRLLALAPEFEENHWLIKECVMRGITVSAAHTNATYIQMLEGISNGISQTTHTFNAMTGLHHRDPGVVGAALESDYIRCELIADNIHVHPATMNALWRAKGTDRIILISDAIRAAGMPDGMYKLGEYDVKVADGRAMLSTGTSLAGSILTMEQALFNFMLATGQPLEAIWPVASLNPARAIHLAHRKGSIEIGKDADLILVDQDIHVQLTVVGGEVVFNASLAN